MSAQDNLSPKQFYHGTTHEFSPGEMLTPSGANAAGRHETNDEPGYRDNIYFTPSKRDASRYAWGRAFNRAEGQRSSVGRVYSVEPAGDYEKDPGRHNRGGLRTQAGLRVVKEVRQVRESDF